MSGELPPLSLSDFPAFFDELWRAQGSNDPYEAFPWQIDLLAAVHENRRWPGLVDLPTGSGKTSLLDIAVFLLAMDASAPPSERWMPRRIALVVDRRVIVDQADKRGGHLVRALNAAGTDVVRRVAGRLRSLSRGNTSVPDGAPLVNTVLRGGIVRDESWAFRPDVPALISSTVDQVGSRLLFRGYGISRGTRPIHAGLLGNDTLFLLDEVHLARPFAQTLSMVDRYRQHSRSLGDLPDRWQVVELTATPSVPIADRFPTGRLEAGSHPVLARRLQAGKSARLEEVRVAKDPDKANGQFADACVREVGVLLAGGARTLAVIVNRVDTARRVARKVVSGRTPPQMVLLTGRMRSMDRDRVVKQYEPRIRMGRARAEQHGPLVVVATQSIEAGADFDLDGIVTECASFDALRQRFGRVDRDGQLSASRTPAQSVVLVRSTDLEATMPDPVYGNALRRTWEWLTARETVDFGIDALKEVADDESIKDLLPEPEDAPLLFPSHLDAWVQTSQPPSGADPDVARWLHGLGVTDEAADVEVIWRRDLDESLFSERPDAEREHYQREISERVASCPPTGAEALSVPLSAFRRWARGGPDDPDTSDVGGIASVPGDEVRSPSQLRSGWVLRGRGGIGELVLPSKVGPGDTVIIPATRGGLWQHNWDPSATQEVDDLAETSNAELRRRAIVRLMPPSGSSTKPENRDGLAEESDQPGADYPDPQEVELLGKSEKHDAILSYLRWRLHSGHLGQMGHREDIVEHLLDAKTVVCRPLIHRVQDGKDVRSYVVSSPEPMRAGQRQIASVPEEDGQDASSFLGTTTATLRKHLDGVGDWAEQLGRNLGMPDDLVADLRLAGRLHDLGKLDQRFQLWLHDSDALPAVASRTEPLAKSRTADTDWRARREAQRRSGYPRGTRHELLSTALIANGLAEAAHDQTLVRYLVSTHHGYGRYRSTPVEDLDPGLIEWEFDGHRIHGPTQHGLDRLDRGIPEGFWQMVRQYGWFELAWLETILRLADQSQSRQEQATGSGSQADTGGRP